MEQSNVFTRLTEGLPSEVLEKIDAALRAEHDDLCDAIESYRAAKETGSAEALERRAGKDPGLVLIVGRIAKGYTQRDLAWRMGVKEQQIQRYEADRYRTISLKNYTRIAALLGVRLNATVEPQLQFRGLDKVIDDVSRDDIRKILKHGRKSGWFTTEMSEDKLRQFIAENRVDFGSPTLLRTGLNVVDHSEDVLLHAWRARVSSRAREIIAAGISRYDPTQIGWIAELPKLSVLSDGPSRARTLLLEQGVILIAEPQIPGLTIDGAAFMDDETPIIGLTLRQDDLSNFWFSLMHEVGHIVLHRKTGLAGGFFDQLEIPSDDEQEREADSFASELLIPSEIWRKSNARIARAPRVVEKLAMEIGINPAIAFGRIRRERNDYSLFSSYIGRGAVRSQLLNVENV